MDKNKLQSEAATLKLFFESYCEGNSHAKRLVRDFTCRHRDFECTMQVELCDECVAMVGYAIERLEKCPYEEKPKCRKCKEPCYEKSMWKKTAKVMRYSGMRLGLLKAKRAALKIFGM
ncbi:MAG: nitrous oxide-stimulated promoter family protein [Epsilonproteobacteria bacterium]|nr:nitrous oxide-stimulated promoter family protein [Campylobacterota bacterium]